VGWDNGTVRENAEYAKKLATRQTAITIQIVMIIFGVNFIINKYLYYLINLL